MFNSLSTTKVYTSFLASPKSYLEKGQDLLDESAMLSRGPQAQDYQVRRALVCVCVGVSCMC